MPHFVRPQKSLAQSRVALVTTGGVHLPDQPRFDIDDYAGDSSYREIPADADRLTWTHAYYRPDEGSDLDAVFPLETLRGLAEEGVVGEVNHRHFSFMGAIHDHGPLIESTAPEVAAKLAEDGVDAVLLTPSCPLCHRSVALISAEVERGGVPTVTLSMERATDAPRVAFVPFPYNHPLGEAGDRGRHREVALAALALLGDLDEPGGVDLPFRWRA